MRERRLALIGLVIAASGMALLGLTLGGADRDLSTFTIELDPLKSSFQQKAIKSLDLPLQANIVSDDNGEHLYITRDGYVSIETLLFYGQLSPSLQREDCANPSPDELFISQSHEWSSLLSIGRVSWILREHSSFFPRAVGPRFNHAVGEALWALSMLYPDGRNIEAVARANKLAAEFNDSLEDAGSYIDVPAREITAIASVLTRRLDPVFRITIENSSGDPLLISSVQVEAVRLAPAMSGYPSGQLDSLSHVVVELSGNPSETVTSGLRRPIKVAPNDAGMFYMTIKSSLLHIYKLSFSIKHGDTVIHEFAPLAVNYF